MSAGESIDVAIVGGGAAGALLAANLAEAGRSVTIFEAGPDHGAGDLISSHIWSRRLRWGGPPVATGGADPVGLGFNTGWGTGGCSAPPLWHLATPARSRLHHAVGPWSRP